MSSSTTAKSGTYRYWDTANSIWQAVYFKTDASLIQETASRKFLTSSQLSKLDGIAANAQVNVLESVQVNGTALVLTNKAVNIDLSGYALNSRKINTKPLSSDVVLYGTDIAVSSSDNTPLTTKIANISSTISGLNVSDLSTRLASLENVINSAGTSDADSVINKLNEVFTFLENTEEGINFATALAGKVPTSRTINGKALTSDITLSAADVGAATSGHTHSEYVPVIRTINDKPLTDNVILKGDDIVVGGASTFKDFRIGSAIFSMTDSITQALDKNLVFVQTTEPNPSRPNDVWIELIA